MRIIRTRLVTSAERYIQVTRTNPRRGYLRNVKFVCGPCMLPGDTYYISRPDPGASPIYYYILPVVQLGGCIWSSRRPMCTCHHAVVLVAEHPAVHARGASCQEGQRTELSSSELLALLEFGEGQVHEGGANQPCSSIMLQRNGPDSRTTGVPVECGSSNPKLNKPRRGCRQKAITQSRIASHRAYA